MKIKHTTANLSAILSLSTTVFIAACGGGGGGNVRSDAPAPIPTPDIEPIVTAPPPTIQEEPIVIAPPPTIPEEDRSPNPSPKAGPIVPDEIAERDRHGGYGLIKAQAMYDRGNFGDPLERPIGQGQLRQSAGTLQVAPPPLSFPVYKTSAAGKYKFWEGGVLKTERIVVGMIDTGIFSRHPEFGCADDGTCGPDSQIKSWVGIGLRDKEDTYQRNLGLNSPPGHGTQVAGVIIAKKDGKGIHGVAHDAQIASYAIRLSNSGNATAEAIKTANDDDVRILNISLAAIRPPTNVRPNDPSDAGKRSVTNYLYQYRRIIEEGKKFVANDGVIVYAAGNNGWAYLTRNAMLPYHVPELEPGFLAVVSTDLDGNIHGSNQCGIVNTGSDDGRTTGLDVANWCIAAPSGRSEGPGETKTRIETTTVDFERDGFRTIKVGSEKPGYGKTRGTSFATPLVSGGIAAIKSLWPYMSYHQIRARILATADDSGKWADSATYGAGMLDLDAASNEMVGGTVMALGTFHNDPIVNVEGTAAHLPQGAIAKYLSGRDILVFDSFDRASWTVPATTYARRSGSRLTLDDLDLDSSAGHTYAMPETGYTSHTLSSNGFDAWSASNGHWFAAQARGSEAMDGVSRLIGHSLPHAAYRMESGAQAVTFGRTSEAGTLYLGAAANLTTDSVDATPAFGIAGWQPESVVAASFVPSGEAGAAFGLSVASSLDRPMGVSGTGPFALSGDAVTAGWGQALASGDTWRLTSEARVAHLSPESSVLTHFDDAILGTGQLDFSVDLTDTLTFAAQAQVERALHAGEGSIRVASSIGPTGRIGYDPIRLDAGDFLAYEQVHLGLGYTPSETASVRAGVTAVRDGFGDTHAIGGMKLRLAF